MNELDRYARSWGATAVPFGPLSDTQWIAIPSQQRAASLLDQTAALRGVMLLSGGNGLTKQGTGTLLIDSPRPYSAVPEALLRTLGIDVPALAKSTQRTDFYGSLGLGAGVFQALPAGFHAQAAQIAVVECAEPRLSNAHNRDRPHRGAPLSSA